MGGRAVNTFKTMLLLAALTALLMVVGYAIGGQMGTILALGFAAVTNIGTWWKSDKLVLRMHKARAIGPRDDPELMRLVEQLARNAEIPVPAIYLIDNAQPNAFATGRNPDNAAVAMTTGIIRLLSTEELAGVIAHEMAHIKNYDTLTMTVSATVSGAIAMISQYGLFFGGSRNRPMNGIATILMAILAPLAAMVIQMMISRTREYAADRAGAEICRNPMWLASALVKISNRHTVMMSAERFPSTAHLFITNPLTGRGTDSLFSTHPDIRNRVAELQKMAKEMGVGAMPLPRIEPMRPRMPWGVGRRRTMATGAPRRKSPWG